MRHIFINHINASAGLHHSELVYLRCFFGVWSIILLSTLEISSIREDQGEVISSAGLKQFRVGEHSTPR